MADVQGFKDFLAGHFPPSKIEQTDNALMAQLLNTAVIVLDAVYNLDAVNAYTRDLAIYTQANFIHAGGYGMQARTSLQAQGVVSAQIVKERYIGESKVPIDPVVDNILGPFKRSVSYVGLAQKERPMP